MASSIKIELMSSLPDPLTPLSKKGHDGKIHDRFVQVAKRTPEAIAIISKSGSYTYGQLDGFSIALAVQIQLKVGGQSGPVAIYGKRSAQLVISMLACSRAGMTFAVLDSAYPSERLVAQLNIIEPCLFLIIETSEYDIEEILSLQSDDPRLIYVTNRSLAQHTQEPPEIIRPSNNQSAYLLFTSGTTGHPKCIRHSHAPLIHFVEFYEKTFCPTSLDHFSVLSGLAHDPIMRDIFVPLSIGAAACIPDSSKIANPVALFDWIQSKKISYLHATPQLLKLLCAGAKGQSLPALKYLFSGGDALGCSIVKEISDLAPQCHVINFYGSTETPQAVAYHIVSPSDDTFIPIGKGITDVQLLVLKDDHKLAKVGEEGEIGVRTHFLSDGYLGDTPMNTSKFIVSPFTQEPADLIYLTGDYGFYREDGAVMVNGRIDDQVKIRGYRVETSEIVRVLEKVPRINECLVLTQVQSNGEKTLIAYLIAVKDCEPPSMEELKASIALALPPYMMPSQFIYVESFPLLPNGKIDRAQLMKMATNSNSPKKWHSSGPYLRETDQKLIDDWQDIFGVHSIDTSKSFNDLGGDSLSFIQASMSLEKALGILPENWQNIPLEELMKKKHVANLKSYNVNTTVIMRAISIIIIVIVHLSDFQLIGEINSTAVLLVLAGWSMATYQLDAVLKTGSVRPILLTALSVAVPTILYSFVYELYKGKVYWQSMLLVSNFYDPNFADFFNFWFLEVLVQIFLFLALLFSFKPVRKFALKNTFAFCLIATLASRVLAEGADIFWNMHLLNYRLPQEKITLVFLGMILAQANTGRRKFITAAVLLLLQLDGELGVFPLLAILLMLIFARIPLPIWLAHIINLIAVSSLFIYLTHIQFKTVVENLIGGENLFLSVPIAIVGGMVVWKVWSLSWARFINFLRFFHSRLPRNNVSNILK